MTLSKKAYLCHNISTVSLLPELSHTAS